MIKLQLNKLSNQTLRTQLFEMAISERKLTAQIIEYVAEVDRRRLYLEAGYPSLFEYMVKELKYSESAAFRRIQAARALTKMPQLKSSMESGSIKLSQVAALQTEVQREERDLGERIQSSRLEQIYSKIENKTSAETEQIIRQQFSMASEHFEKAKEKILADGSVILEFKISKETHIKLKRAKELYSHKNPSADWAAILEFLLTDVLKKRDPLKENELESDRHRQGKKVCAEALEGEWEDDTETEQAFKNEFSIGKVTSVAAVHFDTGKVDNIGQGVRVGRVESSLLVEGTLQVGAKLKVNSHQKTYQRKPISTKVRNFILKRDKSRCQFRSDDGKICGSQFLLEVDHIQPVSSGGGNNIENLRTLCRGHNQFAYHRHLRKR